MTWKLLVYLPDSGCLVGPGDQEDHLPRIVDDPTGNADAFLTGLRVGGNHTGIPGIPKRHLMGKNRSRVPVIPHSQDY